MMKFNALTLSVCLAYVMASCNSTPEGQTAETSSAQEVGAVSENATQFAVDTATSEVEWYGFKPAGQHNGTFGVSDGTLAVENNEIVGGNFTIDLTDIDVLDLEGEDEQKLAGHLKSEDFFHVQEYPEAKFEITSVESYGGDAVASSDEADNKAVVVNNEEVGEYATANPTHTVTGNLQLRDTTLSISFPAAITVSDAQVEAQAKFSIDRTKWNVSYSDESDLEAVAKDKFIYNTVNVGFDIVAKK